MIAAIVFAILMFLAYTYSTLGLVDTLLKTPKLKKMLRIPVGIVNTLIGVVYIKICGTAPLGLYTLVAVLLFVEFVIFYKDKRRCSLFCMLACIVHVIVMHALSVTGFAIALQVTMYDVVNTPLLLILSIGTTFMILSIAVFIVTKVVPAKNVRIINQHDEQLGFMISWLSVFATALLVNSIVYTTPDAHPAFLVNQIFTPIAILIGLYIVLWFAMKTVNLLGYKEKTEELQHTMEKERQYRMAMDKSVFRIVEVNFNKGEIISGFEDYEEQLRDMVHDYSRMLEFVIGSTVHVQDKHLFTKFLSPLTVVNEFEMGTTEITFDYRRRMDDGCYVWMRILIALMRDALSGDVKGFVQIRDIDAEKKQQLDLQYKAERDLLTGLYNKGTTELLISKQLILDQRAVVPGVLFIIDIDNFKMINDRLGHLYGDAVLSELSESLRKVFRDDDIVGRIGGDEFIVFAKGLKNLSSIIKKANRICTAFLQTYANEREEDYTVSSSIGLAIFPKDGENFETLYKCADAALYAAKARGKNGYAFYDSNLEMSYSPTRTEIDTHDLVQKRFKDNKVEYVFRMLYGSEDTKVAIESALELIAKNFGFSSANIFEFNELSTHFNDVFEWCATGIDSVSANYIDMPLTSFDFIINALGKSGGMFLAVPTDFPEYAQESYTSIGIKSIVHFSIEERDRLMGVIAFQYCQREDFTLSSVEFEELRTICQVLSVFMAKQLGIERELRHHHAIQAMMDNMNSIAYVVDRETFAVYYENQNTIDITGRPSIGSKCYSSYRGFSQPCDDCPLVQLSAEKPRCTLELYTKKFKLYSKTSAALIDWSNDRKAMLISSVDVTEYKQK